MADCIGCVRPLWATRTKVPGWHDSCAEKAGIVDDWQPTTPKTGYADDPVKPLLGPAGVVPLSKSARQSANRRLALIEGLGDTCYFCKIKLTPHNITRDHLMPKSKGGSNSPDNVVAACRKCNHAKADMTESEFYAWIERIARGCGLIP